MKIKTPADYAAGNVEIIGLSNIICCLNLLHHQRWFNVSVILAIKSLFYKGEIKSSIENNKFNKL
jgi:hypothetical protein